LPGLLVLGLIITAGWLIYAPALSGAVLLDDISNLGGLAQVKDRMSALIFIFSGDAGPVGRPLALATFVPQASAWGETAEPFLQVNVLIHLVNACLLAWVLYRVAVLRGMHENSSAFVALAATAIWLFMPLLASSSLMIVQRMTTLSASFVLLGLAGYLHARQTLDLKPTRSLIGMSICLVAGTGLAVLAKESGALLPIYALVLEATILMRPRKIAQVRWQVWKGVFLLLPTVVILTYVALRLPYGHDLVLRRDFTGLERLLTQSRILWEYLFHALLPQPGQFGPFHDGYPVVRTILDPLTLLASLAWIVTLSLAVLWRRRYPLLALAVLWYLGGHLLESTVVPLELYFEHRNYLPIIGPVFALCAALAQVSASRQKLAYAGVSAYILVNAVVLLSHTTLWGDPPAAARYWQDHFPRSVRAATTGAQYRLAAEGPQAALQALHRLADVNPKAGYVLIPALSLSCIVAPGADHREEVASANGLLGDVDFSYTAGTMLSDLFTTVTRIDCNGVDGDTVRTLADTLISNRRYEVDAAYNQLHHQLMARILRHEGKLEQAIQHLERAIEYHPSAELNMMMVTTYADALDFDAARAYIKAAKATPPSHPFKRFVWLSRLGSLGVYIDQLELYAKPE
jgi:tetratricopeptide (TPR) repeat protein